MVGLIKAAEMEGTDKSLQDAYDEAVWSRKDLRAIIQQREQAKLAATAQAATQRASDAGSSIRNQPASPVNGTKPGSLRGDIEAAMARLSGR